MHTQHQYDVLIIGSGAAGLTLALRLAKRTRIAVLAKGPIQEGNTYYAQGGISAVLDREDSIESHIADTMDAGAGLCHPRRDDGSGARVDVGSDLGRTRDPLDGDDVGARHVFRHQVVAEG